MIYLASPYSSPDPAVREARFRAACKATAASISGQKMGEGLISIALPLIGNPFSCQLSRHPAARVGQSPEAL